MRQRREKKPLPFHCWGLNTGCPIRSLVTVLTNLPPCHFAYNFPQMSLSMSDISQVNRARDFQIINQKDRYL